jgi:hypothetical protein
MDLLKSVFGKDEEAIEESPIFKQNKKYRLCVEDNPNEKKYGCGLRKDVCVPNCKLSLYLEELTHDEVMELDIEIRNMLERHDFIIW